MIAQYLATLDDALGFDRSLCRCVCQEAEDHLRDAVAADPSGDRLEAERRAIANFGDPHVIAAQFAVISLAKQTRRTATATILGIASVLVAMKARVASYAAVQWAISDDVRAISAVVGSIDRYAFWLALAVGITGFAYIGWRRIPSGFHPAYRRRLRRFFLLCTAATAALSVSVISDGVLTALRFSGMEPSAEFAIPFASMAVEIACAGVLVLQIRRMMLRATSIAALPER